MMVRLTRIFVGLMLVAIAGCTHIPPTTQNPSLVILVSIDGFRADYLERGLTPNIAALAAAGARAQSMRPAFPTITFPNHTTLVTGLYPDHHGIVNNTMEDAAMPGVKFTTTTAHDARWWDGETPIWVTAQRQGLHSASEFWPGSDIPNHGILPDHVLPFDEKVPPDQRTDTVLGWMDLPPDQRPEFIMLYFDQVDGAGHAAGPDSDKVNQALRSVDQAIGRLVAGLCQRALFDRANLIILADHGMEANSPERVVYLDDIVDPKTVHVEATGVITGLRAEPGHEAAVEQALLKPHAHMQCWRKADFPPRLHYGTNPRVPALLCLAEPGWAIWTHAFIAGLKGGFVYGMHGYDPADPLMGALFVAEGPAFKQGAVHASFDNVDVYSLLTHLLAMSAEPNDGKFSDIADMLKSGR
jgi:predicted AlkP superfamily pyrophosphatase or phosphodiesterase